MKRTVALFLFLSVLAVPLLVVVAFLQMRSLQQTAADRWTEPLVHRTPLPRTTNDSFFENAAATCGHLPDCTRCAMEWNRCKFCATTRQCVAIDDFEGCDDAEGPGQCSLPFLLTHAAAGPRGNRQQPPLLPSRYRVIYVGRRTGGPEALVQLHLALLHWGWNSTLETRRKQVGKRLLPFYLETYRAEFERHGVRFVWNADYRAFTSVGGAAEGDVLLTTETWPCVEGLYFWSNPKQVRQLQFHLTIQDNRLTYDVSHVYIPRADPYACTIAPHTHFMTEHFFNLSSKAALVPYVSPHIVEEASRFMASPHALASPRDVLLVDGDSSLRAEEFPSDLRAKVKIAASLPPKELYALMKRAALTVDLAAPGMERLVLESALFGGAVLLDADLNGQSDVDFPRLPSAIFRVSRRNVSAIVEAARWVLARGPLAVAEAFKPFRQYVAGLRTNFLRSVRHYFSDSVHVTIDACPVLRGSDPSNPLSMATPATVVEQLVLLLLHLPFSTATVRMGSPRRVAELRRSPAFDVFRRNFYAASVELVGADCHAGDELAASGRPSPRRVFFHLRLPLGCATRDPALLRLLGPWLLLPSGRPAGGAARNPHRLRCGCATLEVAGEHDGNLTDTPPAPAPQRECPARLANVVGWWSEEEGKDGAEAPSSRRFLDSTAEGNDAVCRSAMWALLAPYGIRHPCA